MRAKVIVTAFGAAALILLPSLYFHRASPSSPPAPTSAKEETSAAPVQRMRPMPAQVVDRLASSQDGSSAASVPDHATYVVARKAALGALATTGNPAGLQTISSELNNPDPEIRRAALLAAVDFGSQDAIPALQYQLEWTSDPQEKVNIQKAIAFLQLPPARPDGIKN
jgi:hypothetical protein